MEHEEVVEFFETAIMYYERVPTFKWLEEAGITPSNSSTVSLADVQGALADAYGAMPYIGCSGARYNTTEEGQGSSDGGRTVISEVWYYSYVSVPGGRTGACEKLMRCRCLADHRKGERYLSMQQPRTVAVRRWRERCITMSRRRGA